MKDIIAGQKKYFLSQATKDIKGRLGVLQQLKQSIDKHKAELFQSFKKDYNKCEFDVVTTELALVYSELHYFIKHLKRLSAPKRVATSLLNFPSRNYIFREPYGVVLIVAPWNYPFQLTFVPLIGAIAAGNTAIVKTSINTKNVSETIGKILADFDRSLIYHTFENEKEREVLFDEQYDFIFYTGSESAAKNLIKRQANNTPTPMVLELGGKSPCIVERDAHIVTSVRRVLWGKFLNAGQTCVAPDYLLIHKDIKDDWLRCAIDFVRSTYYENGELSSNFTHIINEKKAIELEEMVKKHGENVLVGGKRKKCAVHPTIINNVTFDDEIMKNEIFGPILPVIEYNEISDCVAIINARPTPLALYYFSNDEKKAREIMSKIDFGGGAINDTIMHVAEKHLPFGGKGASGLGNYHGKFSFETFSHSKSVLVKNRAELKLKYPPQTNAKLKIIKTIFKI